VIEEGHESLVHHFLIYSCVNVSGGYVERYWDKAATCRSPTGDPSSGCIAELFVWAYGGGSLILPPQAGFLMNNSENAAQYIVIEIHYDNPNRLSGVSDHSGVRVHWTPVLREYNAGVMAIADAWLNLPAIPPQQKEVHREISCPSECTSEWTHDIHVFNQFNHQHQIGDMFYSTLWNKTNHFISEIGRTEYYSFDHQHFLGEEFIWHRGDRMNVHCVWNSMSRTNRTFMGLDSSDEMCFHYIYYYPALYTSYKNPYLFCGYFDDYTTVCGNSKDGGPFRNLPQPRKPDPEGWLIKQFGTENCGVLHANAAH